MNFIAKIKDILNSNDFTKNILIIFSGSVMAQFLPLIAMPFLSRLYSPSEYGVFGLYLSIGTIISAVATLRYSHAIQISKSIHDSFLLLRFCIVLIAAFSMLTLIVLSVFYFSFSDLLGIDKIGKIVFTLPLFVLFSGLNEVLLIWLNRNKNFKYISYNRILNSTINITVSLLWALIIDHSSKGLIFGLLSGQMISTLFMFHKSHKESRFHISFDRVVLKNILYEFKHFPIYSLPSDLINVVTNQLPVLLLSKFGTVTEVGYYNMSNRILGLPTFFISSSIGEVFRQRATEDFHKNGSCLPIFNSTFKMLGLLGILPFLIVGLFGPWLFSFFLGEEWKEAGEYSQIFAVLFYLRFIVSPLTYTFYIAGKQKTDFFVHILMLVGTVIPFYYGLIIEKNIIMSLIIFSVSYSMIYILYFYFSKKFTNQNV